MATLARNDQGIVVQEPPFVKMYLDHICDLNGLSSTQKAMVNFFLTKMDSENEVIFRAKHRDRFCRDNKISPGTFLNNIKALTDSAIVERIGNSEFLMNKKYFVKVDWHSVQKIRMVTEFTPDGKVTNTVVIDDKDLPY
tara:strand:+ start:818 stop:1234 length:417 start_codon:yes stop_codon:yes gene_type:complete